MDGTVDSRDNRNWKGDAEEQVEFGDDADDDAGDTEPRDRPVEDEGLSPWKDDVEDAGDRGATSSIFIFAGSGGQGWVGSGESGEGGDRGRLG